MDTRRVRGGLRLAMLAGVLAWTGVGMAQEAKTPANSARASVTNDSSLSESVRELRQQVLDLQAAVAEVRAESQQYHAETAALRRELEMVRGGARLQNAVAVESTATQGFAAETQAVEPVQESKQAQRTASLDEEYALLSGKVDDQYQTKIESASKYRIRMSGLVLLNLFSNRGALDNSDFPTYVTPKWAGLSGGEFGATVRQSQVGFEVFGPQLGGARTRGNLQLDLGGGFPTTANGVSTGLLRLRTATMRMDWENTSIVAGQDSLFFSPESPTSFASLAVPALSYAGNLWGWAPQVRVEHRVNLGEDSKLVFQGGILDPLSGEPPGYSSYRVPGPGEASRQPAFATRVGWEHNLFGQPLRVGVAGYTSRQNYGFDRNLNAWAGMTDLQLPIGSRLALSGKLYRGSGVGGLSGGIGRSVELSGDPSSPSTLVRGLNGVGGWAQLKYRATSTLEFNGAFGEDNAFSADVKAFRYLWPGYGDPTLLKNQGSFVNFIYRPRSDLLFSAEYHHMKTFRLWNPNVDGDHINLMMGVLF